mmetsp:Transcript_100/g.306  ORF Transcript_100/g.306 Transcript_100/m.306 type:complete len:84 (+) Transcript_100:1069-1320(+)
MQPATGASVSLASAALHTGTGSAIAAHVIAHAANVGNAQATRRKRAQQLKLARRALGGMLPPRACSNGATRTSIVVVVATLGR